MRGDVNAVELYQDREFLLRLGYGMMDVPVGSTGDVGFEDVRKYSYLEDEEEDPKLYRRRVFNLIGRYYQNDLAKILWHKFKEHQIHLHEREGWELCLAEAAQDWLERYGHEFFKSWTLEQPYVPFRLRNHSEPHRGWLEVGAAQLAPQWRELIEVGFGLDAILLAIVLEGGKRGRQGYLRLVARLSGHRIKDRAELEKRQQEIEQLQRQISRQTGQEISWRAATLEYFRRLNLVAEIEGKSLPHSLLSSSAC
jgi:hypothetical protein